MRTDLVHPGADELHYEIRAIVALAKQIESLGTPITWENIGDPVAKGEEVPDWIRELVANASKQSASFAYSPTQGILATRQYIAEERNREGGIQISADDILFFNGLGDAISKIYSNLNPAARLIGPNPAYPTHSSAEAAHSGQPHLTYSLDPNNSWQPDLAELESQIQQHPEIAGIVIINPDNPTGFVYPREILRRIVGLARAYKLFIVSDEIYSNLAFNNSGMKKLASVIEDVPAIAMRGISKEFPWPGGRCGWIEFYNRDKDQNFDRYCQSLINAKMLEVCSTTLPQLVLPQVMSDQRYHPYLRARVKKYEQRSKLARQILSSIPELIVHEARGAFYMTAVFEAGVLTNKMSLSVSEEVAKVIEPQLAAAQLDQRFTTYLLAATGICTVPLSTGFNCQHQGFRLTLLEPDEEKFKATLQTIAKSCRDYIDSGKLV